MGCRWSGVEILSPRPSSSKYRSVGAPQPTELALRHSRCGGIAGPADLCRWPRSGSRDRPASAWCLRPSQGGTVHLLHRCPAQVKTNSACSSRWPSITERANLLSTTRLCNHRASRTAGVPLATLGHASYASYTLHDPSTDHSSGNLVAGRVDKRRQETA